MPSYMKPLINTLFGHRSVGVVPPEEPPLLDDEPEPDEELLELPEEELPVEPDAIHSPALQSARL